jgi:hypothetical protein
MSDVNYSIFDAMLQQDSSESAVSPEARFFIALHSVVRRADFSPEEMGIYMAGVGKGQDPQFAAAISGFVDKARVIRNYLEITHDLPELSAFDDTDALV